MRKENSFGIKHLNISFGRNFSNTQKWSYSWSVTISVTLIGFSVVVKAVVVMSGSVGIAKTDPSRNRVSFIFSLRTFFLFFREKVAQTPNHHPNPALLSMTHQAGNWKKEMILEMVEEKLEQRVRCLNVVEKLKDSFYDRLVQILDTGMFSLDCFW